MSKVEFISAQAPNENTTPVSIDRALLSDIVGPEIGEQPQAVIWSEQFPNIRRNIIRMQSVSNKKNEGVQKLHSLIRHSQESKTPIYFISA